MAKKKIEKTEIEEIKNPTQVELGEVVIEQVEQELNGVALSIFNFFEKLKQKKIASDEYRWRKRLMPDECKELFDLYNLYFKTNEKYCKTCSSNLSIVYDRLFDIYQKMIKII